MTLILFLVAEYQMHLTNSRNQIQNSHTQNACTNSVYLLCHRQSPRLCTSWCRLSSTPRRILANWPDVISLFQFTFRTIFDTKRQENEFGFHYCWSDCYRFGHRKTPEQRDTSTYEIGGQNLGKINISETKCIRFHSNNGALSL